MVVSRRKIGYRKVGLTFIFVLFYNLEQTMVKSDNVVPCKYVSESPLAPNLVLKVIFCL